MTDTNIDWNIDWKTNWDEQVGLWWQNGQGHTRAVVQLPRVHAGRDAADKLVQAAMAKQLDRIDVAAVLRALRRMQMTGPGEWEGCFKWYWEEEHPIDTNAAFFTGMNLLVLHYAFREQLNDECRGLLDAMLGDLERWFAKAVRERHFFYPNKFLGDLVCEWLLLESLRRDTQDDAAARIMLEAADYWLTQGWGWGEHMSDGYCGVCLNELSLLLLFSKRLPQAVHEKYRALFADLLSIEDRYDGGVRVPMIRGYAFASSPTHTNYRDAVRSLAAEKAAGSDRPRLQNLFHDLGWHHLVPARQKCQQDVRVPCYGGAVAMGHNQSDVRLGSMSRYPVMPHADHPTWGLSWQSFPVAMWRPEGDWGFLQWESQEGEDVRAHPTHGGYHTAYLFNALTRTVSPPAVGRTYSIQHGGNLVALRIMPMIPASWKRLCDRFRLIAGHGEVSTPPVVDGWAQTGLEVSAAAGERAVSGSDPVGRAEPRAA